MIAVAQQGRGRLHRARGPVRGEVTRCRCGTTLTSTKVVDVELTPVHPSVLCARCFPSGGATWRIALRAWRGQQVRDA